MTPAGRPAAEAIRLRLYVAGDAPNSRRARVNARRLCAALGRPCDLEIIDVLEAPARARADGVTLTPTLVKAAPPPAQRMVGDLGDMHAVAVALGIGGQLGNGGTTVGS